MWGVSVECKGVRVRCVVCDVGMSVKVCDSEMCVV